MYGYEGALGLVLQLAVAVAAAWLGLLVLAMALPSELTGSGLDRAWSPDPRVY